MNSSAIILRDDIAVMWIGSANDVVGGGDDVNADSIAASEDITIGVDAYVIADDNVSAARLEGHSLQLETADRETTDGAIGRAND